MTSSRASISEVVRQQLLAEYPSDAAEYEMRHQIGQGASAAVFLAVTKHGGKEVVVKVVDLEVAEEDALEGNRKEIAFMGSNNHENIVNFYTSFLSDHHLWIVMEYCAGGSCLDIMKFAYPNGFEQAVIATILKEALRGLVYMHSTGRIHRDIKAGNLLVKGNGTVLVGDFGVSAWVLENGTRKGRYTFVGTPCWMAPEVMEQSAPYNESADIWSFGITALELAYGKAPYANFPPMKVLMFVLSKAPPCVDKADIDSKRFGKSFADFVDQCLQKDPAKRPSAAKLLEHKFFKHAKKPEYMVEHILANLPPLWQRFEKTARPGPPALAPGQEQASNAEISSAASKADEAPPTEEWEFGDK
mmetsp:Transcript_4300/g.10570  ORF Transcript_4300/g.10570 Transcript_4300/m.10570 type:complete len:359 (-) Transcript_4300:345-1421(-)|eukprot:CAMPEP_0177654652 /NCGR_PEP_ID=MMETSP0447-20121125/14463_1 /TAXON_ID=0 /ORGANISM="Stygamoeba regulata, Strain BSH-02190019" /LENGTH=358 /DNA_ID=CAMNT_0019158349 /DNA_START=94 /DNA_END=1170 /DNA_ORIENTATION=+